MIPYWILYFMAAIPALNAGSSGRPLSRGEGRGLPLGAILAAAIISLVIGLRFEVGADWYAYIRIFEDIRYLNFSEALRVTDPAFSLLNWLVATAGLDYWVVNLLCGIIFSWGLFAFAFRLPQPWLALAVAVPYLVVVVAMGYSRQGVALGCVMLALAAVHDRALMRFLFWILFATMFHKTAIVVLPIVALAYTHNRLLVLVGGVFAALLSYYILILPSIDTLMYAYVEQDYESEGTAVRIAMNVVPAFVFWAFKGRFILEEIDRRIWRNFTLVAIGTLVALFIFGSATALDRLALYLIPLQLVVFSHLPEVFGTRARPSGIALGGVLAYSGAVQFVWLSYAQHSEAWLPYRLYPSASLGIY